jgi:hypothetical protein
MVGFRLRRVIADNLRSIDFVAGANGKTLGTVAAL